MSEECTHIYGCPGCNRPAFAVTAPAKPEGAGTNREIADLLTSDMTADVRANALRQMVRDRIERALDGKDTTALRYAAEVYMPEIKKLQAENAALARTNTLLAEKVVCNPPCEIPPCNCFVSQAENAALKEELSKSQTSHGYDVMALQTYMIESEQRKEKITALERELSEKNVAWLGAEDGADFLYEENKRLRKELAEQKARLRTDNERLERTWNALQNQKELTKEVQRALSEERAIFSEAREENERMRAKVEAYRQVAFDRSIGKGILPADYTWEAIDAEAQKIIESRGSK